MHGTQLPIQDVFPESYRFYLLFLKALDRPGTAGSLLRAVGGLLVSPSATSASAQFVPRQRAGGFPQISPVPLGTLALSTPTETWACPAGCEGSRLPGLRPCTPEPALGPCSAHGSLQSLGDRESVLAACFAETSSVPRCLLLAPCLLLFKGYKIVRVIPLHSVAQFSVRADSFPFSAFAFPSPRQCLRSFRGKALWLLGQEAARLPAASRKHLPRRRTSGRPVTRGLGRAWQKKARRAGGPGVARMLRSPPERGPRRVQARQVLSVRSPVVPPQPQVRGPAQEQTAAGRAAGLVAELAVPVDVGGWPCPRT